MTKTVKYIIAVACLLGINLFLFFFDKQVSEQVSRNYFRKDDLDQVSSFLFVKAEDSVKIERSGEDWVVNDTYPADQQFVSTLVSILKKVEVAREIGKWEGNLLGDVEVEYAFNARYRFQFASNPTKTKSYFLSDGTAKEVRVPGYRDQVVDLFALHPDQWRDRMILDGSWRTIQRLEVQNSGGEDFEIVFEDRFFKIDGQQPSDSSAVVNYLNQFQQFQANEMISPGRFPDLDSLSQTRPMARVTIDDLKMSDNITLEIFPSLSEQAYHLVKISDLSYMVIDANRIQGLLFNPQAVK